MEARRQGGERGQSVGPAVVELARAAITTDRPLPTLRATL